MMNQSFYSRIKRSANANPSIVLAFLLFNETQIQSEMIDHFLDIDA